MCGKRGGESCFLMKGGHTEGYEARCRETVRGGRYVPRLCDSLQDYLLIDVLIRVWIMFFFLVTS